MLDFFEMLTKHDWQFEHAEDFRVWTRGLEDRKRIAKIALESDRHADLYTAFCDFHARRSRQHPTCPKEET
jgi:hypothetical protein